MRDADAAAKPRRRLAARLALIVAAVFASCPAHAAPVLRAVRTITTPEMTRLIVEFSEPVTHRIERSAARADLGVPDRIGVVFPAARLDDAALIPKELPEGPVVRLRATHAASGAARLLLDVPGFTDVGTFFLPDPYRLIIDVRGTTRAGKPRPTPQVARTIPLLPLPRVPAARPPGAASSAGRLVKVVLDPGHGGKDPGALGVGGVAEKDIVLMIAKRLKARLAAEPGVVVVLTRETDVFLALEERTARANAERADLFISIHANASPNPDLTGTETYYLNNTDDHATLRLAAMENGLRAMTGPGAHDHAAALILSDLIQNYKIQESVTLAQDVQRDLVQSLAVNGTPVNDLGVKRGPFYVLVGAGMPGVLVEVSFLTHPQEGARLAQASYQDAIAAGLLRAIKRSVENTRAAGNL